MKRLQDGLLHFEKKMQFFLNFICEMSHQTTKLVEV